MVCGVERVYGGVSVMWCDVMERCCGSVEYGERGLVVCVWCRACVGVSGIVWCGDREV